MSEPLGKSVLLVLGKYLPNPSANGICCDEIVKSLRKNGFKVTIIANREKDAQKDEVGIYRVPRLYYKTVKDRKNSAKTPISKVYYSLVKIISDALRLVAFLPFFPVSSPFYLNNIYRKIKTAVKENDIDLIFGVNMPVDTLYASYKYKLKHKNIGFIGYFLDPLAGGAYHYILGKEKSFNKALSLEKKIVENADAVIVQKEHRAHYEQYYSEKELENILFFGAPLMTEHTTFKKENDINTIVYAGALSKEMRDPSYIFEVFRYVKNAKLKMYVTNGTSWVRETAKGIKNIEINERISHDEIVSVMEKADGFLNIGNSQLMYAPSKIIEYISFGKPLISTYRVDNDTSDEYIKRFKYGISFDERTEKPEDAAKKIDGLMTAFSESVPFEELSKEYKDNTPQAVVDVIKEILNR